LGIYQLQYPSLEKILMANFEEFVVPADQLLLSVEQAAQMTGIGRTLAYELVRSGEWPIKRVRGRTLVIRTGLEKWAGQCSGDGNEIARLHELSA